MFKYLMQFHENHSDEHSRKQIRLLVWAWNGCNVFSCRLHLQLSEKMIVTMHLAVCCNYE